jgi:multidrug efflux system membrane fusion protein
MTERALGTDQGRKFVYVVNSDNEVVYQPVTVGSLIDGLRVIEDGLSAGDKVIISGLQRVRPGIKVEPKPVKMPEQKGKAPLALRMESKPGESKGASTTPGK